MIQLNAQTVTPTHFPDKTSQVWKIPGVSENQNEICWEFDGEQEVPVVCQLAMLTRELAPHSRIRLNVPFLPYGRQDKSVANDQTFALHTFGKIMAACGIDELETFDAHSDVIEEYFDRYINHPPTFEIEASIAATQATHLCFPDFGAAHRYSKLFDLPYCSLQKVRNQTTGEIVGLEIETGTLPSNSRVLIIDDICDGGRTFIESAKLIFNEFSPKSVALYVSHGIFSKGTQVLRDAGIDQLYTRKGLVK